MKYLFAVNPVSGKGKAKLKMNELAVILKDHKYNFMIYETQPYSYAEDLRDVIINEQITHVFAVGGDGTAHEVLNAVVGLDVFFGIIPFGSGNDFARVLNLPKKSNQVFKMIENNNSFTIDVGKINNRYFLNYVSLGLDVLITKHSLKFKKLFNGGAGYVLAIIKGLISYKTYKIKLTESETNVNLITIHNGKFYGGGMKINPFSEINDGLLSLCKVKKISKLKLLMLFPSVYSGKHYKFKNIVSFDSKRHFSIESEKPLEVGIDGEVFTFDSKLTIDVIPECVKLIRY